VAVLAALGVTLGGTTCGFTMMPTAQSSRRRAALLGSHLAGLLVGSSVPCESALGLTPNELATIELFRKASPSVLMISDGVEESQGTLRRRGPMRVGSGFAWDQNHVVTTASTMKSVSRPRVTVLGHSPDGEETRSVFTGALVGLDPVSDVAVLWVDGAMKPLRRGSASDLHVGQDVYALGNPFGFEHSFSKGVVSGLARTLVGADGRPIGGIIQTDASINPGNNGGPLLDSTGAVVGVNNAILSSSGAFAGVGLAVPIETIERSVTSVIIQGFVRGSSMGVVLARDSLSQELGIDGVMVRQVTHGSPAELAGLRPMRGGRFGDIIVGIDSKPVHSIQAFFRALDGKLPGDEVVVSVRRAAEDANKVELDSLDITVELGSRIL